MAVITVISGFDNKAYGSFSIVLTRKPRLNAA